MDRTERVRFGLVLTAIALVTLTFNGIALSLPL